MHLQETNTGFLIGVLVDDVEDHGRGLNVLPGGVGTQHGDHVRATERNGGAPVGRQGLRPIYYPDRRVAPWVVTQQDISLVPRI